MDYQFPNRVEPFLGLWEKTSAIIIYQAKDFMRVFKHDSWGRKHPKGLPFGNVSSGVGLIKEKYGIHHHEGQ